MLSIHTVFILRENIIFLDEWIAYHRNLGVEKFFLYDNSGSVGFDGSNSTTNKYNVDFNKITKDISEEALRTFLEEILVKYKHFVFYIRWQPTDKNGDVIYGQTAAVVHFIKNFGHLSDWTAFIDIDEFIYCYKDVNKVIQTCEESNIGRVLLLQKKFDDRFNNLTIPVTQIEGCIEGIDTRHWAPKCLIKNQVFDLYDQSPWNIHSLPVKDCEQVIADPKQLRFNHYNTNRKMLSWMKKFYHSSTDFQINGICLELKLQFHSELNSLRKQLLNSTDQ